MRNHQSVGTTKPGSRAEPTPAPKSTSVPSDLLIRAVEAIQEAVILYDVEGRIHYANAAVETIYGYTPKELIGRSIRSSSPQGVNH